MKNNYKSSSIYEWLWIIVFIESVWRVGRLIDPNASSYTLRFYTAIIGIFIFVPLRFVFLIFFPGKENNEDTDE